MCERRSQQPTASSNPRSACFATSMTDFFNHDSHYPMPQQIERERHRKQQADTITKINVYLHHGDTLSPEGVCADTHLLISRRAHDASNGKLVVRRIMDLYLKIRKNVSTSSSSSSSSWTTHCKNNLTHSGHSGQRRAASFPPTPNHASRE